MKELHEVQNSNENCVELEKQKLVRRLQCLKIANAFSN